MILILRIVVIVIVTQIVLVNSFQGIFVNTVLQRHQHHYHQQVTSSEYHLHENLLLCHGDRHKVNKNNKDCPARKGTYLQAKHQDNEETKAREVFTRHLRSFTFGLAVLVSSTISVLLPTIPNAFAVQQSQLSSVSGITVSDPLISRSSAFGTTTSLISASDETKYDGFAEYAKDNQMEQSDVSCFINKCGDETKNLFQNPRGIKGIVCLGQCKGEQSCATRCFAEYGSENLNNWLSCTIEVNECVKVPKNIDNSAENIGYTTTVSNFNPKSLVGTWYKTDGLNPNYDLFDCQTNTFHQVDGTNGRELDMDIFFRVNRPLESGGGYWENVLTEHMMIDAVQGNNNPSTASSTIQQPVDDNDMNPMGRTLHTSGKMYGLQFSENWYIIGESDGTKGIPEFKLVAYKGHTLQGNYEGAFVYAKEPILPSAAIPAVRDAAQTAGLNFDDFTRIDNTCPVGETLNDNEAGTGTSTTDWINLVIGEGGVIDWISPGWRGEYKAMKKG